MKGEKKKKENPSKRKKREKLENKKKRERTVARGKKEARKGRPPSGDLRWIIMTTKRKRIAIAPT